MLFLHHLKILLIIPNNPVRKFIFMAFSLVIWPPTPIPNYTNKTIPNHISSIYLQLIITAISIHNATLLSCHFRKIATVSHFRLVLCVNWLKLWLRIDVQTFYEFISNLVQKDIVINAKVNRGNIRYSIQFVFNSSSVEV